MNARETTLPIGEPVEVMPMLQPAYETHGGLGVEALQTPWVLESQPEPAQRAHDVEAFSQSAKHVALHHGVGIEIAAARGGGVLARFSLQLGSVSSAALASDRSRWTEHGTIALTEAARQRALSSLACSLQPGQGVRFIHLTNRHADQSLRYRMLIEGEAAAPDRLTALQQARELLESLQTTLAAGMDQFGFEGQPLPEPREEEHVCVHLMPAAVAVRPAADVAFAAPAQQSEELTLMPLVPNRMQTYLESVVAGLLSLPAPTRLVVEWRAPPVNATAQHLAEKVVSSLLDTNSRFVSHARLQAGGGEVSPENLQRTHRVLQGWVAEPLGAIMQVSLHSATPIAPTLARMIGHELFLGRPFSVSQSTACTEQSGSWTDPARYLADLLTRDTPMPPLLPTPLSVDAAGFGRLFPAVEFNMPDGGIVLGDGLGRGRKREIRLADIDRTQHCYIAGQTGSGKTRGLLEPMALQDMARGEGVFYLDLDGDSFDYLHAACPPARRNDIVSLDFTDFNASPALNLLQFQTRWPRIERSFIVDNLVQIFKYQYPDTPEGFGPMFELYLTHAAHLVMEVPGNTVLEIVRVFADPIYRRCLLAQCKDPVLTEFWRNIAARAGGEASLENIAPYIVSKLTKMVADLMVQRVVGQAQSTIDFRAGMDSRKIFLIKLSKGLLSEDGARFLGMLLTTRLFGAALSRADLAPGLRVPCHVYLDEFQNLVSPAIEGMLAESRKYGLRLTLANQNLAQLPLSLSQTVLSNCATKVILRTGMRDAELLAPWVSPHFSASDLMSLPNRHAVARVMVEGAPSPPFVLRMRTQPGLDQSPAVQAKIQAIRDESRQRYYVDAEVIDQRIAARRAEQAPN